MIGSEKVVRLYHQPSDRLVRITAVSTTTGQMIFDVFLSSGTAGGSTKKYTVAHKSNTATVYNKIIEITGTPDFTVTFANTTVTNTGDAVACTITPTATQTVSYTIQVGFDNANTVVVS